MSSGIFETQAQLDYGGLEPCEVPWLCCFSYDLNIHLSWTHSGSVVVNSTNTTHAVNCYLLVIW